MEARFSPRVKDVITFSREEALRLGHDYIGFDLSDDYHNMARERISNPTKRELDKFTEECGIEVNIERGLFNLIES